MSDVAEGKDEAGEESGDSGRVMHVLDRIWKVISNAAGGMGDHRGTQLAASMAYYALLAVFPAAIVAAAAASLLLDDPGARSDVVEYLLRELPLSEVDGRSDVESLLDGVTANSGTLGLIGGIALLVTASALISAARNSLNVIFGEDIRRGFLRGKGLDLVLVVALGALFVLSFAASVAGRIDVEFDGSVGGVVEDFINIAGNSIVPVILSGLFIIAAFKILPAQKHTLRDMWPGLLFAWVGYEVIKRGFSVYLESFSNYSAVYGSLGAVIAFMVFVYLASFVFLFGAEMASVWPGVREGDYDGDPDEEGESVGEAILGFLKRLFTRNPIDR